LNDFHRQRLIEAAKAFGWIEASQHSNLKDLHSWTEWLKTQISIWESETKEYGPKKVRVLLNKSSEMSVTLSRVPETTLDVLYPEDLSLEPNSSKFPMYRIMLDTQPTKFTKLTWLKTTRRPMYDTARERMPQILESLGQDPAQNSNNEVLLYNEQGDIIEGSVTNVYFWRNDTWTTPFVGPDHGGLEGTARKWAISKGLCKEGRIPKDSIQNGELVWISNGVRGFLPGNIFSK